MSGTADERAETPLESETVETGHRANGADAPDAQLKPSAMRGPEFRYGVAVALILLVVAVLNLAVRHGPGAPKHPQTGLAIVGLVAALAVFPILLTRNRFIAPFAAVIAAFFVTLPSGPNSVKSVHVLAIVFPLVYALVLTQRQRKLAMAAARSKAASRQAAGASGSSASASPRGGRRRKSEPTAAGPSANRRYTPPKAKKARR